MGSILHNPNYQPLRHGALASFHNAAGSSPKLSPGCRPLQTGPSSSVSAPRSRSSAQRSSKDCRSQAATTSVQQSSLMEPSSASAAAQRLSLAFGTYMLPHPDKASYGGEDAHFVSPSALAFGVADGVGGWSVDGINPAEYSRMFMRLVQRSLEAAVPAVAQASSSNGRGSSSNNSAEPDVPQLDNDAGPAADDAAPSSSSSTADCNGAAEPQAPSMELLRGALAHAHKGTRLPGSSTACVLQLDAGAAKVNAAVLGDSVFIHIRNGQVVNRGKPGLHFFDCPFQFGNAPEHTEGTDTAEDADVVTFAVRPGDVMVVATDGIWDNLPDSDMLELVPSSPSALNKAAQAIGELASRNATDSTYDSPYAAEARKAGHDLPWWEKLSGASVSRQGVKLAELTGGKIDDITVVIGMVTAA